MTLLTEMMQRPLDPGYAVAAQARREEGLAPSTGLRTPLLIIASVVIGLLLTTAALTLRAPQTSAARAKADLVSQIESRRAHGDALAARITGYRSEIDAAQATALAVQSQSGLAADLDRAELVTGAVAARGPGLVVTVDDAPQDKLGTDGSVDPREQAKAAASKVTSRDLQQIVNGLWQAGAEAVSVNDQRLTARSAIRFAGQAILVDYRPLSPPYVITAIGDPQSLAADFAAGSGGSYLQSLESNYGIQGAVQSKDRVQVPGASSLRLLLATPAPTPAATPGGTSSSGTAPAATTERAP